jgi:hypothetical protein
MHLNCMYNRALRHIIIFKYAAPNHFSIKLNMHFRRLKNSLYLSIFNKCFQLSNSLKSRQNFFEKKSNSRMLKRLVGRIVIIPLNSKISILNSIGYPIGF